MKVQFKSSEVLILLAASVMSFLANLPDSLLGSMVDRKVLLASLSAIVIVAMFRYLQMFLLLTICILAIGANLPSELAAELGISQVVLLISLGALIALTLLNRFLKLLPTTHEDPVSQAANARRSIMLAIAKGDMITLQQLLATNATVNFEVEGMTPLHLAAEKGYSDIVRLLISHGADFRVQNAQGKTALDIALEKKKFVQTTELLFNASKPMFTIPPQTENRRADAEQWRQQHGY